MKNKKNKINKIKKWVKRPKNLAMIIGVVLIPFFGDITIPLLKNDKIIENKIDIDINNEIVNSINPEVKGVNTSDNFNCDSDFLDKRWKVDNWWMQNEQEFIYKKEDIFGGPKMIFSDKLVDNFLISFEFMPIENIDNKDKEINLVIYIGDLYKVVIEKIYKKNYRNEMESFDSLYVAYIKDNNKALEYGTGAEIIKFENNISFNKWSKIKIVQESSEGLLGKTVTIEIFYFPDNIKNSSQDHEKHVFNIEDTSSFGTLKRELRIGLQIGEKESTFITKFNCFKLENR